MDQRVRDNDAPQDEVKPVLSVLSVTGTLRSWRVRTVRPHVSGRLLDIGCGTNDLVRGYAGEGKGVDVHDWGDVVVEDSSQLPFPDGSFDTVTILAALNHIPNREEVLVEAHRVLEEKGLIIVTMIPPNISRVWHRVRRPWDPDQHERGHHHDEVWGITRRDLNGMLADAGFVVERECRFMLGVNTMTIARRSV